MIQDKKWKSKPPTVTGDKILAIDIGGSHIKSTILNLRGELLQPYEQLITPDPSTPHEIIKCIKKLSKKFTKYDKISVGFPGYVKKGVVYTAPNLSDSWKQVNLSKILTKELHKPAIVINDADMQGLGISRNMGFEIVLTLGTGFGTSFLVDGKLLPHFEIAHHPFTSKKNYDAYIGNKALKKIGQKKWNSRMKKIITVMAMVFNYDHLYIGGGNAAFLDIPLAENISVVTNRDGIHGGARLWQSNIGIQK